MTIMPTKLWIIGYGNIGKKVANLYQTQGVETSVTTRSKESLAKAKKTGQTKIAYYQLDLDSDKKAMPAPLYNTSENLQIFYFVPPPKAGKRDTRLTNFLRQINERVQKIVLISTTGVYGDCDGSWVDEQYPLKPFADRAWRRMDAEQQLMKWGKTYDRETVILRVPGIYSKDRLPLARLEKGLPMVKQDESPWTNRIHADDLAMICFQAMQQTHQSKHEIYNVSDGHPSTMTDYFNQVADYSGLPRPRQITLQQAEQQLSPGMMSYMRESRRICNDKMIKAMKITLKYPSLADCLKY